MTPPRILTIAGSDSGGGAGIQADLKTFTALGCYGMSVITSITAQNTVEVRAVEPVSPEMVGAQIDAVFDDIGVDAVKIGMLGSGAVVAVVAERLSARPPLPMVLDPVMVAKSGDSLLADDAISALIELLFPRATLVTPNLPEASRLVGHAVSAVAERQAAARELVALGASAALVKGGHGVSAAKGAAVGDCAEIVPEDPLVDWLFDGRQMHRYVHPRIQTQSDHGTGCTLSAAIAAELGSGVALVPAVQAGLSFLQRALRHAVPLGQGRGPVNHVGRYRFEDRLG